jgi:hypothetical protein
MTETPGELADKLAKEGEKSAEFFGGLADEDWGVRVYDDGAGWDARTILIHLAETEEDIPQLMRSILSGGEGVEAGFDIDEYNARRVGATQDDRPAAWLARFVERRSATATFVAGLSGADLQRRGRHPFLGETEIVEMIRLMYLHAQMHQRDIRRALRRG